MQKRFRNQPEDIDLGQVARSFGWHVQFDSHMEQLRDAAVSHTLDDEGFFANGGMAGRAYNWDNVPRATLPDGEGGQVELIVAGYKRGDNLVLRPVRRRGPPASVTIYSTEPDRAEAALRRIGYLH